MPKCVVCDRPTQSDLNFVKEKGRMLFVIIKGFPPEDAKQVDMFIDGFLAGCEVERSEIMAIFFNDTDLSQEDARLKFTEKYRNLKFPEVVDGYTTVATGKKGNLLSKFLGCPAKEEIKCQ
jgi:hypothetical protein